MLLTAAAQHDVNLATTAGYPKPVLDYVAQTWRAFLQQATDFLDNSLITSSLAERNQNALENISSIGVWFTGPQLSLPLRRYTVQVVGPDGIPQNILAVGLLSFAYSSYVMQLRAVAQQSVLDHLCRIEEQLGAKCLFLPQILIAPS